MAMEQSSSNHHEVSEQALELNYVENAKLEPGRVIVIETVSHLLDEYATRAELKIEGELVAGIQAGNTLFEIIDTRQTERYNTPFLVVTTDYQTGSATGFRGIWPNKPVIVGRGRDSHRFPDEDPAMSREHFALKYDEEADVLLLQDCLSTHGTYFTGFTPNLNRSEAAGE